jgi:Protein of unknown function (DUF998)
MEDAMTTIEARQEAVRPMTQSVRGRMTRTLLLACGVLSSLLYVATDILGGLRYEGYRFMSRAVSELGAIGAPSKALVTPLFLTYDMLLLAFGFAVRGSDPRNRSMRVTGSLLIGIGGVGLVFTPFAPMHMRGAVQTLTDTMHIVLTGVTVVLILLAIGFGATALGKRFRAYSIATMLVLLVFGGFAGLDGPRIAAQLPTPWLGLTERINIYGYLLWVLVLAAVLLSRRADFAAEPPSAVRNAKQAISVQ